MHSDHYILLATMHAVPKIGNIEQLCDLIQFKTNLREIISQIRCEMTAASQKNTVARFFSATYAWWIGRDRQFVAAQDIVSAIQDIQNNTDAKSAERKKDVLLCRLYAYCLDNMNGSGGRVFQLVAEAYWQIKKHGIVQNTMEMRCIVLPGAHQ